MTDPDGPDVSAASDAARAAYSRAAAALMRAGKQPVNLHWQDFGKFVQRARRQPGTAAAWAAFQSSESDLKASFRVDTYSHAYWVRKALREGRPVPPEVLADYPDGVPQAQAPFPRYASRAAAIAAVAAELRTFVAHGVVNKPIEQLARTIAGAEEWGPAIAVRALAAVRRDDPQYVGVVGRLLEDERGYRAHARPVLFGEAIGLRENPRRRPRTRGARTVAPRQKPVRRRGQR